jgi:hypothetical protein
MAGTISGDVKRGLIGVYHESRLLSSVEPKPHLWLPESVKPSKRPLDTATVLAVISLVATVALGVLGVAHMIPLPLLIAVLFFCLVGLGLSLWRSQWLERKQQATRCFIVIGAIALYAAITGPALWKLMHPEPISTPLPKMASPQPVSQPISTNGDCSPVVTGSGNAVNSDCGYGSERDTPKRHR